MKKLLNNKKAIIVIISLLFVAICIFCAVLLKNELFSKKEKEVKVSVVEQITPLQASNSAEASDLVKANTVKVINKIDEENSIIGTGFFDKSGYLITNSHIVDIKGNITIEYANGNKTSAQLYSNDITSDIALLTVEKPSVKALYYGNTLDLRVTDDVYAIGYPFAFEGDASVSKGVLAARRSAGGIEFLQSDISLNTGNSGGPLINDKGELLGINTYATDNASIGMSISSESLQIIINKLIDSKSVNYVDNKRSQNALSVVLNEIGYDTSDIYNENKYVEKHDGIHDQGNGSGKEKDKDKKSDKENKEEYQKSHDNYLSNLTIQNYDINFNSGNTTYYVQLKNQESSLNINVTTSNSKAKYVINGNSNFKEGNNMVTILVTAENGSTRTYETNVVKPVTYLDGIAGVLCCLDVQRHNGVNSFQISGCDFIDSDRVRIPSNVPLDVIKSVKIDVYAGWNNGNISGNDTNGKLIRFLKSYSFNQAYSYNIPLSDIRAVLNDDDYEGGSYQGADLTFYVTVNTRNQGSFSESLPWGLSK